MLLNPIYIKLFILTYLLTDLQLLTESYSVVSHQHKATVKE